MTRRRRRRRGGSKAEESDETMSRRSRKQQYIDEITDVEGSTRLEAKKQRRRDNRRERSRQNQLMEQDFLARRENVDRLMVVRESEHHTQISVIEDNVSVEHYVSDIQEVPPSATSILAACRTCCRAWRPRSWTSDRPATACLCGEVNWDSARLEGHPRRIELAFKSGDPVLVQVTKDPIGHKGARLTSQVTLAGRFLAPVPSGGMTGVSRKLSERERARLKNIVSKIAPKDMGVYDRTAAKALPKRPSPRILRTWCASGNASPPKRDEFLHGKCPKLLQGEPDVAIRVVGHLQRRLSQDDRGRRPRVRAYRGIPRHDGPRPERQAREVDPAEHDGKDVFDKWQIDSQLRKGMERQVYLPSGGSIVIDRTEAMTTIDVNTGRFIGRGKGPRGNGDPLQPRSGRRDRATASSARHRRHGDDRLCRYGHARQQGFGAPPIGGVLGARPHQASGGQVTSLGLVQMTRKRIGQGLVEAFSEECPTCKGRGFILHDEPTVSADYDDPYALKGGDPFVKTNKHGHGTDVQVPKGSLPDVKAKLAQIAAAAGGRQQCGPGRGRTRRIKENPGMST